MYKNIRTEKKWKILVTPKEACESLGSLPSALIKGAELFPTHGRIQDAERLIRLLYDKDGVILDLEKIDARVFSHCPNLKVISRFGEGCDAIDLESAKGFKVSVTRTSGASSSSVARHTMALILAMTHHLTENDRNLKRGLWLRLPYLSDENLTLGIVGFGKIGRLVADLARGLGFKILIYSRRKVHSRYKYVSRLEKLIELSDIVTLHLPLKDETKNIISEKVAKRLKGKFLVNTSRGGLVDERALLKSLEEAGISGYATDVFLNEPISGISKALAAHPKVVSSPHISALNIATNIAVTERAVENALYCLNGKDEKVVSYVVK